MPTHKGKTSPKANLKDNPSPKFKVSLKLPGKTYSQTASTILEALNGVETPVFFKSKGIVEAEQGKIKSEVWMYPAALRKLFANPMSKVILAKRLSLSFK